MISDGFKKALRRILIRIRIQLIRRYGLRLLRRKQKQRTSTPYGEAVRTTMKQGNIVNDRRNHKRSRRKL